jgi:hypothetical protein
MLQGLRIKPGVTREKNWNARQMKHTVAPHLMSPNRSNSPGADDGIVFSKEAVRVRE